MDAPALPCPGRLRSPFALASLDLVPEGVEFGERGFTEDDVALGGEELQRAEAVAELAVGAGRERARGGHRSHPRYRAMRLTADAVACAANAGKVAAYTGNPLAFT
ncbi:MAG TPA: hypothetical protein VFQ38_14720 [Longimicrobiales bacterium]|nr:hypothetical protein [Longimicrobiales bacterium]